MKTQKAYYEKPVPHCAAEIREVRRRGENLEILLDRTIFYPEGGGQSADRGKINGVAVLDVVERDGEILHICSAGEGAGLAPGPAELELDMARRRDLTVHHTAQHLLSGTILAMTGKPTVSMHLGEEFCTIDVDGDVPDAALLARAEEAVQDAIEADCPVIIHLCPPENIADFPLRKKPPQTGEVIRVVEICGHDFSPCCGTHLESAGGIGILRILGVEKYKGMARLTFIAGRRVLRHTRLLQANVDAISRSLSIPPMETARGVLTLLEKAGRLEREIKALREERALGRAEAMLREKGLLGESGAGKSGPPGARKIHAFSFPDTDIEEILMTGRAAEKLCTALLVLGSPKDARFAAFSSEKDADIGPFLQKAMEERGGKGGGRGGFFQGRFPSAEALDSFLKAL